jgi:hypothetical protein
MVITRVRRRLASVCHAVALICGLAGLPAALMLAQPPQPTPDIQALGPQVGSRVPDFRLADQHGQTRTLQSLVGPNGLMLVFFRSADW